MNFHTNVIEEIILHLKQRKENPDFNQQFG